MPTDLFFLNTMPQNQSLPIQRSKIGSWAKSQFPNTYATDKSWGANHKSFAATLRKASQDHHATCSREGYRRKSIARKAFEPVGKPDGTREYFDERDEGTSEIISSSENREPREIDRNGILVGIGYPVFADYSIHVRCDKPFDEGTMEAVGA